jgi:RNA polymerase sigma-70 factor (ECF subfamily)
VRQLVSRGRRRLEGERRREVGSAELEAMLAAFIRAARAGDIGPLERLLAADAVSYSDGGGAVRAARVPVVGRETVAKFIHAFASPFWEGVDVAYTTANGGPAALLTRAGEALALVSLDASDAGIHRVFWVMNPEKLAAFAAHHGHVTSPPPASS